MRIACLQFAPQVGDVNNNLNRADSVLSKANPGDLDLLVLPELAFSGYNFKSLQEISPFLERSGCGISSLWARTIALKYNCNVVVGYPEKVDVSPKWPTSPEYYDSAIVVNGDGETIANYRKNFLYSTDETWALEGNRGFYDDLIPGLGNTSIGICMDINPYKFEAPWNAFEFAYHVIEAHSNLVIVSMAWMTREDPHQYTRMPNDPDMETLTYWVTRLEPIIRSDNSDEIIVVFCNRTGNEADVLYAGTSAVVGIQAGEVNVYGIMGRGEKGLLVVDTNKAPYAKLVYRPDAEDPVTKSPGRLQMQGGFDNPSQKQASTAPSLSQSFLPEAVSSQPPQPLRPLLKELARKELAIASPKRRENPPINIPRALDLTKIKSPLSPGLESLRVSTPSAPSPTPMAVRPRLVIPQSPPLLPHQYPPDHPMSAASLRSNESEASTVTVCSNPRPPEDSTPFPSDATPLSGYPSNSFTSERRTYGARGIVDATDGLGPDRLLNDLSIASPPWEQWWKGDTHIQAPSTAETWTSGTPMWRKPEPFPWPAITSATASRRPSRSTLYDHFKNSATPQDTQQAHPQYAQSNAPSNRTDTTNKAIQPESSFTSKGTAESNRKKERSHTRSSSTISRNASRSGRKERHGSFRGQRGPSTSTPQHLEGITRRGESAHRMRDESPSGIQLPDRPPSTKSRNHSRNRPEDVADLEQSSRLIHIAASPGILKNDDHSPYRSLSRTHGHQRSNSFANSSRNNSFVNSERSGTPSSDNKIRPASRAASRGRTTGSKVLSSNDNPNVLVGSIERSASTDSTRNVVLHTRVQGLRPQSRESRSDGPSSARSARRPSQRGDRAEFARVEAPCSSCPAHGPHSSLDVTRLYEPMTAIQSLSPRAFHRDKSVSSSNASKDQSPRRTELQEPGRRGRQTSSEQTQGKSSTKSPPLMSNERGEASDLSSPGTIQSTPGRSPTTPCFFTPTTPRAILLKTDDLDIEPLIDFTTNSSEKTPTTRYIESELVLAFNLPVNPVAT